MKNSKDKGIHFFIAKQIYSHFPGYARKIDSLVAGDISEADLNMAGVRYLASKFKRCVLVSLMMAVLTVLYMKYGRSVEGNADDKYILLIIAAVPVLLFFLLDEKLKDKKKRKDEELMKDYPEIVCKILLYYNAGLSLRMIIGRLSNEGDKEREVYRLIAVMDRKISKGVSLQRALREFGKSCNLSAYIKLSALLTSGMRSGSEDFINLLRQESDKALFEMRAIAQKKGELISTKLLGPMVLMLIVTMLIVMVPAFMSMGV